MQVSEDLNELLQREKMRSRYTDTYVQMYIDIYAHQTSAEYDELDTNGNISYTKRLN